MRHRAQTLAYRRIDPASRGNGTVWKIVTLAAAVAAIAALTPWLPWKSSSRGESSGPSARQEILQFETALDTFEVDGGRYPTTKEGLAALLTAPPGASGWQGPYIKSAAGLLDPWGRPFVYRWTPGVGSYEILSVGPDGKEGTADDITGAPSADDGPSRQMP